ncbi:MAG: sulfite exporter TauE/SafE family protein [bacterium]
MIKKLKLIIGHLQSDNDQNKLETAVNILAGIKSAKVDLRTNSFEVEYEDSLINQAKIADKVEELGYSVKKQEAEREKINEQTYFVKGMHCASCEVVIERELTKLPNVKSVDASNHKGSVLIEYTNQALSVDKLNQMFKADNYSFSDMLIQETKTGGRLYNMIFTAGIAIAFILVFVLLKGSGLSALINVNDSSALPMFLLFGLMAGFSSCAALVGGIILSMSKQWGELYSSKNSMIEQSQPHFLFNAGRLASYAVLGAVLGGVGSALQLSLSFSTFLIFAVSLLMIFLALQMMGVKALQRFQISMPKFATRYVADQANFKGKHMPFIMGAATFLLPCGFTITAQSLALTSGSAIQGGLIMLFFAIGTLPGLLAIGLSSVKFIKKPHLANKFLRIAGIIVLFFAIFNINSQLNVMGWKSLDDINFNANNIVSAEDGFPEIVNGVQILKMDALSYGYEPNRLKVRAGIPVRWEINDKGTSGCTNAVMSKGLFDGEIKLTPGQVSIKEFTPEKPGRYKFSCWMGMISGTIDVVEISDDGSAVSLPGNVKEVDSGAKGCGCGGGSTCGK